MNDDLSSWTLRADGEGCGYALLILYSRIEHRALSMSFVNALNEAQRDVDVTVLECSVKVKDMPIENRTGNSIDQHNR